MPQQDVGITQYGSHGRADFMAHVCQKLALGTIGGQSDLLAFKQPLFLAFAFGDVDHGSIEAGDRPLVSLANEICSPLGQNPMHRSIRMNHSIFDVVRNWGIRTRRGCDGGLDGTTILWVKYVDSP